VHPAAADGCDVHWAASCEELGVAFGRQVGCKIRFAEESSPQTLIKFMTDGILLAETQGDRDLHEYEAITSMKPTTLLNIDFYWAI
jgi:ATP-dependent helicase HrpA